jgi:tripartite-type tricarboxylate transporter receptor subunit TctC
VPDATALGQPDLAGLAQFRAIAGPPGMAPATLQRLSAAFVAALRQPAVLDWAKRNHASLTPDGAAETHRILQDQMRLMDRWKDQLGVAA